MNYSDNFSDNLKMLRTERRLSQIKLAEALNVAQSTIAMLETGERKPSYEMLELIADYFNVRLDDLSGRNKGEVSLSYHEIELIKAYRTQPEMQEAVDKLLGLENNTENELPQSEVTA